MFIQGKEVPQTAIDAGNKVISEGFGYPARFTLADVMTAMRNAGFTDAGSGSGSPAGRAADSLIQKARRRGFCRYEKGLKAFVVTNSD